MWPISRGQKFADAKMGNGCDYLTVCAATKDRVIRYSSLVSGWSLMKLPSGTICWLAGLSSWSK